jgi:excisionase family DNA binding protein
MGHSDENATGERIVGGTTGTRELPAMLSVDDVAALLACSTRHAYRLAEMGRIPRPVKLGALVRWPRAAVLEWIDQNCPDCKEAVR